MASHLVGQHQQTSFATPVNGAAGDATVVLGNDNATVTTYNAHDIDPTIHVQDSNAAVFAVTPAGTAGRKWMTNDTGGVYLYFDTGATWVEVNYQRTSSTGAVVIVSTSTPQLTVEYDGTHTSTFSVSSAGALTINATSTVTITPATTITGALTLSSALTYGGVTLSNAVTGTGNMVLSASPTFTGTINAVTAIFSNPAVGDGAISVRNTNAGAAAYTGVEIGNDATTDAGGITVTSSVYTPSGLILADCTYIYNKRVGGISIQATNASGAIRFAAGGASSAQLTIQTTGALVSTSSLSAVGFLRFTNSTKLNDDGDGILSLLNSAGTSFTRLNFGGTSSSFPALRRSSATIDCKFADDSGFTEFNALSFHARGAAATAAAASVQYGGTTQTTVGAAGGASALPAAPTGYIIVNVAGTNRVIPYYAAS